MKNTKPDELLQEMVKSFASMKKNKAYLKEAEMIENSFNENLPEEDKDDWWKK